MAASGLSQKNKQRWLAAPVARTIDTIVVHCSVTRPHQDIGVKEIRSWHRARGFVDIGYHLVIRRSGAWEFGRSLDRIGAHVSGHNARSIGICLVGGYDERGRAVGAYTAKQWSELEKAVAAFIRRWPTARVVGHNEIPVVNKACPCFIASEWWAAKSAAVKASAKARVRTR